MLSLQSEYANCLGSIRGLSRHRSDQPRTSRGFSLTRRTRAPGSNRWECGRNSDIGTKWRVECSSGRHHWLVSATPAWPVAGPPDRDELASWSTAELADAELGSIPPLAGPLPQGWTELVDGRGVFVRRQRGPAGATPVWFVHGLGGSSTDWTRLSGALSPLRHGLQPRPAGQRAIRPPAGREVLARGGGGPDRAADHAGLRRSGPCRRQLLRRGGGDPAGRPPARAAADPHGDLAGRSRPPADPRSGERPAPGPAAAARHRPPGSSATGVDPAGRARPGDGRAVFRSSGAHHRAGLRGRRRGTRLAGRVAVDARRDHSLAARPDDVISAPRCGLVRAGRRRGDGADPGRLGDAGPVGGRPVVPRCRGRVPAGHPAGAGRMRSRGADGRSTVDRARHRGALAGVVEGARPAVRRRCSSDPASAQGAETDREPAGSGQDRSGRAARAMAAPYDNLVR